MVFVTKAEDGVRQWENMGRPEMWRRAAEYHSNLEPLTDENISVFLDEDVAYGGIKLTVIDNSQEDVLGIDYGRDFVIVLGFVGLSPYYHGDSQSRLFKEITTPEKKV